MNITLPYEWKRILLDFHKLPVFEIARHKASLLSFITSRPRAATINVTGRCNSKCITCRQWKNDKEYELTTIELVNILKELKKLGFLSIGFGGGEPLLRADLETIIKSAVNLGFGRIAVTSNGLLMTEDRAQCLIESGMTDIGISIEGLRQVHDYCRGVPGGYEKSMNALNHLVELRNSRYPRLGISMATILMEPNLDYIIDLVEMCKMMNIGFSMQLLDTSTYFFESGQNMDELAVKDHDKLNRLIDSLHRFKKKCPGIIINTHSSLDYAKAYYKDPIQKHIPCFLGYINLYINPQGDIFPGCYVLGSTGNIRNGRLTDILNSQKYKIQRRRMFEKKCPGCSCNYPTNLAYHLRSRLKDLKWYISK